MREFGRPSGLRLIIYRELIRYFGDDDPATRIMLDRHIGCGGEHTNDMHDLLVAHEGRQC